ncbi:MAG: trigger factor [Oscillospiraceae bacterium]|nr:trigger factor [Oscillospiraceae bacterium]
MSFTYRGLKAQMDRHIITEDEINRNLERLRQQNPRIAKITDRPTENGDEVVLDYAGFCDGEQFAGGTAEKQTLVLGSGTFIPGFEEQLLDKVCGEKVTVKVTFPKQYHAENLAGKEAEFHCTIHEIRVKTEYELDDNFAKEFGHCENLEQMRQKLGESLQAFADERGEMDLQDRLLRQAAATLEVAFTEAQIEEAVAQQMKVLEAQLARQGLSLEMYCSFMNTTTDDLRKDARATAETNLLQQAAIDMIIQLEGLQAEEAEIAEALEVICQQNNMTMEQMQSYYDAEFEKAVKKSVLTSKALRLIRDAADVAVADK